MPDPPMERQVTSDDWKLCVDALGAYAEELQSGMPNTARRCRELRDRIVRRGAL